MTTVWPAAEAARRTAGDNTGKEIVAMNHLWTKGLQEALEFSYRGPRPDGIDAGVNQPPDADGFGRRSPNVNFVATFPQ